MNIMQNIKKISWLLLVVIAALFNSCKDEVTLPVLTEDEYPRILGRWPERLSDGSLGSFGAQSGQTLTIPLQFTPSNLCEGTWYLDGEVVYKGTTFTYISDTPGTHTLKLEVKTSKYTTTREALLIVN